MDEIQSALTSPVWWFTAIFIALTVNLVSSYFRDGVDTATKYIKNKLEREKIRVSESNQKFMQNIKTDPERRRFLFEAEIRARLMGTALLIGSAANLIILSIHVTSATRALPQWAISMLVVSGLISAYYSLERYALAAGLEHILLKAERERTNIETA